MEDDNGNTFWIAVFFPIEGIDIRHLEAARLVCRKGSVKGIFAFDRQIGLMFRDGAC